MHSLQDFALHGVGHSTIIIAYISTSWCGTLVLFLPTPMPPSPSPLPPKTRQNKTKRINITVSPGRDQTLTQHLVDRSKLIDDECKQLVELAKEVQKHAVEHTKNVRYAHG